MTDKIVVINYLHVKQGDITREDSDAIVNAANTTLLGGGGVDGAIHRAAGPGLLNECRGLGGCKPGEARITGGYNLKARHVIHTPGPVYRGGKNGEAVILANSYRNSLSLAKQNCLKSISFPAISTGVYGYPLEEACMIAVDTVMEFMCTEDYILDVNFVLYDSHNYSIYQNYISRKKNELS